MAITPKQKRKLAKEAKQAQNSNTSSSTLKLISHLTESVQEKVQVLKSIKVDVNTTINYISPLSAIPMGIGALSFLNNLAINSEALYSLFERKTASQKFTQEEEQQPNRKVASR